jgi:enamine deaminase RidA (YjgF/YER057c/UK114 family)
MRIRSGLERNGLALPEAPSPIASYIPAAAVHSGRLLYVSGQIPVSGGSLIAEGLVPRDVSIEQAQACARQCVLNALACVEAEVEDLDRVRRVVRLEGFVACEPGFGDQPAVINGASDLLVDLMGDFGKHTRIAVGVPALPMNAPVEIGFTFLVD